MNVAYTFADAAAVTNPEPKKSEPVKEEKPKAADGPAKDVAKEKADNKAKEKEREAEKAKEKEKEKMAEAEAKTKEKEKEKQADAVKAQNEAAQSIDDKYTYDSIYVNGVLKVTKRKKKK